MQSDAMRAPRLRSGHPGAPPRRWPGISSALALSLFLAVVGSPASADLPTEERDALIALYNSTNGPGWINDTNWLGGAGTECTWFGVTCIGNNVDQIELRANELAGAIPPEIGNLSSLTSLRLSDNRLTGGVPSFLANLTNLTVLVLDRNRLQGQIPPQLGALVKLQTLGLADNQLNGSIPSELFTLSSLQELYLDKNQLGGSLSPAIGNLSNLRLLWIHANHLVGAIPVEIGNLTNLEELSLGQNFFEGSIPAAIGGLTRLRVLALHENQLSGNIPAWIADLTLLRDLTLGSNQLSGSIPPQIGNLKNLTILSLQDNALVGEIPSSMSNLTSLQSDGLRLSFNCLYTNDASLRAFIDSRLADGPLEATQTVAPSEISVTGTTPSSIALGWTTIPYSGDSGSYRVYVASDPEGPYFLGTTTSSKLDSSAIVERLLPGATYSLRVETVTRPHGSQQNEVVSGMSEAVVAVTSAATGPEIVVASGLEVMTAFADGVSSDSTMLTIANVGLEDATVTLLPSGGFFTISATSLTVAPGTTASATVSSVPQTDEGDYRGTIALSGEGVPSNLNFSVSLFAAPPPPTGRPQVEVESTRVDVTGPRDTDPSGMVSFRNTGTGIAIGILGADQSWIVPENSVMSIEPGESRAFSFVIDRSRRPDASTLAGSQQGTLVFVYIAGADTGVSSRSPFQSAPSLVTPVGITDTVKPTAVECPPPPLPCLIEIPPLGQGQLGLVAPGVGNVTGSVGVFISDVTIGNRSGLPVDDLALYFGDQAVTLPIDAGRAVSLADVSATVFDTTEFVGALHLRSNGALDLSMNANVFVKTNPRGTFGTALPVFRTDRGVHGGSSLVITGLRKSATSHTNIYVQELTGRDTTVDLDFLDPTGAVIGSLSNTTVAAFGTTIIGQALVPDGSVTAKVSNTGTGSISAFATPVDRASNDTWAVADWGQVYGYGGTETQYVAVAGSAPGRNETYFQTDLAIYGESSGTATLRYYQQTTSIELFSETVQFAAGETQTFDDVVATLFGAAVPSLGSIEIEPGPGLDLTVTSRTYTTVTDSPETFGTGVPTLSNDAALRHGQSLVIGGLEDSKAETIDAGTPATFRTNVGLVEIDGKPLSVRISVLLFDGKQLAAGGSTASRTYDLAAHEWRQLNAIVGEIVGREIRESDFGELKNVQVRVDVIEGAGAVIVYATATDNGTGDTLLRIR